MTSLSLDDIYMSHQGKVSEKWAFSISEYERLFSEYRTLPVRLLEIGKQDSGSLGIWSEYFNSLNKAVGCQINPDHGKIGYDHPAITILNGNANHEATEQKILEQSITFDIIIDDATAKSADIVATFIRYFPHLENNGIFVIEGLCSSYREEYEGTLSDTFSSMVFFNLFSDVINHEHWKIDHIHTDYLQNIENEYGYKIPEDLLASIRTIEFYNSMCVIRKTSYQQKRPDCHISAKTESFSDSRSEILQTTDYHHSDILEEISVCTAPVETLQEVSDFSQVHFKRNKLPREFSIDLNKMKKELLQLSEENANLKQLQNQLIEQNFELNISIHKASICLNEIYNSRSWRLTRSLRTMNSLIVSGKQRIRHMLRLIRNVLRFTRQYVISQMRHLRFKLNELLAYLNQSKNTSPVSFLNSVELEDPSARLLAYYLPQAHLLEPDSKQHGNQHVLETQFESSNDLASQFKSKEFAIVEGDQVHLSQIVLAKRYGISGLCFAFQWFNGKKSLDSHISDYRRNPSKDLPFCLCWENENQSLNEMDNKSQDDLEFIVTVSSYMLDPRYIRINDQPLLLISEPALLPSGKETTERWRNWCRENGIGEIFLACPDSSNISSPVEYGFNTSIKAPQCKLSTVMSLPAYSQNMIGKACRFFSKIFSWDTFSKFRIASFKKKSTASCYSSSSSAKTTKNDCNGSVAVNHSPFSYQQWLYSALKCVVENIDEPDERIILTNGWNKWNDNSQLHPDRKNGYAFLEATRMALLRSNIQHNKQTHVENETLAIVIHAFYLDVLEQILEFISNIDLDLKLFVTTPEQQEQQARDILIHYGHEFELLAVDNRGRDVWPFFQIMPKVTEAGHEIILKLHTKKSKHLKSGNHWRIDIYQKLMAEKNVRHALDLFKDDPEIGIIGPENHVYSMSSNFIPNKYNILRLAARMGIKQDQVSSLSFAAGTMFYARVSALQPILNLAINEEDFDREAGQTDGTFAHALERGFSISNLAVGKRLVDTSYAEGNGDLKVVEQFRYS